MLHTPVVMNHIAFAIVNNSWTYDWYNASFIIAVTEALFALIQQSHEMQNTLIQLPFK